MEPSLAWANHQSSVVRDACFGIRTDSGPTPTPTSLPRAPGQAAPGAQVAHLSMGEEEKHCKKEMGGVRITKCTPGLRHGELAVSPKERPKLSIRKIIDV